MVLLYVHFKNNHKNGKKRGFLTLFSDYYDMGNKETISVTVDSGLPARVRAQGLKVSEVCNTALHAALIEEKTKLARASGELDAFNAACGYVPFYETLTERDYNLSLESKLAKNSVIMQIKRASPEWDNEAGVMRWLAKKYGLKKESPTPHL